MQELEIKVNIIMQSEQIKKRILITDTISPSAVNKLREEFEVVTKQYSPDELLLEISKYHEITNAITYYKISEL